MSLTVTPQAMQAAYDYLAAMPPFNRWSMPDSSTVEFTVSRAFSKVGGYAWLVTKVHQITISDRRVGRTEDLIAIMAHEMVHAKQVMMGERPFHGKLFNKLARPVCRAHGFDPKSF